MEQNRPIVPYFHCNGPEVTASSWCPACKSAPGVSVYLRYMSQYAQVFPLAIRLQLVAECKCIFAKHTYAGILAYTFYIVLIWGFVIGWRKSSRSCLYFTF